MKAAFLTCLLLLVVSGCAERGPLTEEEVRIAQTFDLYPGFAKQVAASSSLVLYEGLPHQVNELDLYKRELQDEKTVELSGYTFYFEPLDLSSSDSTSLVEAYTYADNFQPFRGMKTWCEFHPDFAFECKGDNGPLFVMVCFTCWETRTFSNGEELYCEMTYDGAEKFRQILKEYPRDRPDGALTAWLDR